MRKLILIAILIMVLLVALPAQAQEFPLGDVDHDGEVRVMDALFIAQSAAGVYTAPYTLYLENGDVNGDGETNIVDAIWICQMRAGLRDADYNWIGE